MQIPRFSLRQLAYFVAVAEAGSIRAACTRLNISHAALSAAVEELEAVLGTCLLIRRRARGISLTPAGTDLLREARALLEVAEQLPGQVMAGEARLAGRLGVGCYTTLAPFLIPRLFSAFGDLHPGIQLDLTEGSIHDITALLRTGRCEVAIVYDFGLGEEFRLDRLYAVAPHVVLSAGHRLADRESVDLRDLIDEPLIVFDVPQSGANTQDVFAQLGLVPRIAYRSTSFELVRGLAARGLGYALMLQRPAAAVSYDGAPLVTLPVEGYGRRVHVAVATSHAVRPTLRAEAFRRHCLEAFAQA
ncbi:LysR family transcriptional regulator [Aquabacter sp. P-9]|uniref:LysR family transcriptional regulator n=1 Tax=Aquabacter sediminis TaxID=3029197 RepID=UPI00237D343A|nr:LysR family transcriptional regulator [Aquabacter sp. P-9]MDE1569032.1 LysR family transcriptional regulator [Aquabacter sp. P-9]